MAATSKSSSEDETDPQITSTSKMAITDTESISYSPRGFESTGKTNRTAPLGHRGQPSLEGITIETARKVDEALAQWSGEDPSVIHPFPGIKLHKQESKEDMVQRALSSWAGQNWQEKDAAVAVEVSKKARVIPKAFPGIDLHDDSVRNLAELPGAKGGQVEKPKIVPVGLSFPGIPIHTETEDIADLPGAKARKSSGDLGAESPGTSPRSSSSPSNQSSSQSPRASRSTSPKSSRISKDPHSKQKDPSQKTTPRASKSKSKKQSAPV